MNSAETVLDIMTTGTYKGFDLVELQSAFDEICDPEDWKAPINRCVAKDRLDLYKAAVEFYAAVELRVVREGTESVQVYSIGYRAGPAGP